MLFILAIMLLLAACSKSGTDGDAFAKEILKQYPALKATPIR
ncbi:hypothetical protein [Paenibacillus elgii]|nr:hypothetical protein [Paenibacillus elgii]